MKLLRILLVAASAALLTACDNEAEFEQFRVALAERPDVQAQILAKCESKLKYSYYELRQEVARYARLKLDGAMPGIVCKRVMKGYLNGRMKWADYEAIMESGRQRVTPNMTRIVRSG